MENDDHGGAVGTRQDGTVDLEDSVVCDSKAYLVNDPDTEPQRADVVFLKPKIGLAHAVAMVVGGIIGSGIFISPSFVLKDCRSIGLTLIMWMSGGLVALLGGLCYCELANTIPKSGGTYVYLKFAFGDLVGFLYTWIDVCFTVPGYEALMSISFAMYATEPFHALICGRDAGNPPDWLVKVVAASLLIFIGILNGISPKTALFAQNVFATSKLLAIVTIVGVGITRLAQGHTDNFKDPFKGSATSPGVVGLAFYSVMFSYGGSNSLSDVTEEVRDPERNFPRTILLSLPIVASCYVLVNVAFLSVLSPAEYGSSSAAVVVTFGNKLNPTFGLIMPLVVALSCLGSLNMVIFCSCRTFASMAMEKQVPSLFALVHRETQVPVPAVVFRALSAIVMLPFGIETLLNWLLFFGLLTDVAVYLILIMLRLTKPELRRGYKVNIVVPIFMMLVSGCFTVAPFLSDPLEACYGLAVVATGIPLYYILPIVNKWKPQSIMNCFGQIGLCTKSVFNLVEPARKLQD